MDKNPKIAPEGLPEEPKGREGLRAGLMALLDADILLQAREEVRDPVPSRGGRRAGAAGGGRGGGGLGSDEKERLEICKHS